MNIDELPSRKSMAFTVTAILVILAGSAFVLQEKTVSSSEKNIVESIELQDRPGNVVRTKIYIVKLANDSDFSYRKTVPGPGMLCDANSSEGNCETKTEQGYTEIELEISESEFKRQDGDFSTFYTPVNEKCAGNISGTDIELNSC